MHVHFCLHVYPYIHPYLSHTHTHTHTSTHNHIHCTALHPLPTPPLICSEPDLPENVVGDGRQLGQRAHDPALLFVEHACLAQHQQQLLAHGVEARLLEAACVQLRRNSGVRMET